MQPGAKSALRLPQWSQILRCHRLAAWESGPQQTAPCVLGDCCVGPKLSLSLGAMGAPTNNWRVMARRDGVTNSGFAHQSQSVSSAEHWLTLSSPGQFSWPLGPWGVGVMVVVVVLLVVRSLQNRLHDGTPQVEHAHRGFFPDGTICLHHQSRCFMPPRKEQSLGKRSWVF